LDCTSFAFAQPRAGPSPVLEAEAGAAELCLDCGIIDHVDDKSKVHGRRDTIDKVVPETMATTVHSNAWK
jgi:hypothetical protein